MRIGLMVGPHRGYRQKASRLAEDAAKAELDGFCSLWVPQIPNDFEALTALTLMGLATDRVELGTAVLVLQGRHPIAFAQQILSAQAVCDGRLTVGLGPSHHWVIEDMFGLPYERPAHLVKDYLEVLQAALAGPGAVNVENDSYRVHYELDITDVAPTPVLLAALGPVMLRIAGEQADGTVLWLADERAIAEHIEPKITKAAADAGRPAPRIVAGVPVALCGNDQVDEARAVANRTIGHAEYSPNYQRLMEQGDANDVGDLLAAGDEAAVLARLERFRDAGVTDLSVRPVAVGNDRQERIESAARTQAFMASLCPEI